MPARTHRTHPARWAQGLLIVARDRMQLYRDLQRTYRDTDEILVVRDRRQGERRQASHPVADERRHGDRRRLPALADELRFQQYALIYPTDAGALAPHPTSPRWRPSVVRYLRDRLARLRGTTPDH